MRMQVRLLDDGLLVPDPFDQSYVARFTNIPTDSEGYFILSGDDLFIDEDLCTIKTKNKKDVALLVIASSAIHAIREEIAAAADFEVDVAGVRERVFGYMLGQLKESKKPGNRDKGESVIPRKLSSIILFVHLSYYRRQLRDAEQGNAVDAILYSIGPKNDAIMTSLTNNLSATKFDEFFSPGKYMLTLYRQYKKKDEIPPAFVPEDFVYKVLSERDDLEAYMKLSLELTHLVKSPEKGAISEVARWVLGSKHGENTSGSAGWMSFVYKTCYHWVTDRVDFEGTETAYYASTAKKSKSRKVTETRELSAKKSKSRKNSAPFLGTLNDLNDSYDVWAINEYSDEQEKPCMQQQAAVTGQAAVPVVELYGSSVKDNARTSSADHPSVHTVPVDNGLSCLLPAAELRALFNGLHLDDQDQHKLSQDHSHSGGDEDLFRLSDLEKDPVLQEGCEVQLLS